MVELMIDTATTTTRDFHHTTPSMVEPIKDKEDWIKKEPDDGMQILMSAQGCENESSLFAVVESSAVDLVVSRNPLLENGIADDDIYRQLLSSFINEHLRLHGKEDCTKQHQKATHVGSHFHHPPILPSQECGEGLSGTVNCLNSVIIGKHKENNSCRRSDSVERPFKCSECGKGYKTKFYLDDHMRTHTGERPFKCRECGKGFTTQYSLKIHKRIHALNWPCSECGKRFTSQFHLKIHISIHTGEKPFKCSECGQGFTTQSSQTIHERRMHTGEKQFKCSECGKGFTRNIDLETHKSLHTGDKPFKCSECGKGYTTKKSLDTHKMTIHIGERPFQCSKCGKGFTRKVHLEIHKKRIHSGEGPFNFQV